RPRILVVDDDPALLRAYERTLTTAGYAVTTAGNGHDAKALLGGTDFDAIVSDISMPGMDGLQLLRAVRERDLDVPVLLVTGDPQLGTAMRAVDEGALRYLVKPVDAKVLEQALEYAVRLRRLARVKREALALMGVAVQQAGDRAGLEASFGRALESLWMAYQPIVAFPGRSVFGYEALVRTAEPAFPHPGALFDAAERLDRLYDLGRAIRASVALPIAVAPALPALLFVNLHTRDLLDDTLFTPDGPLALVAHRVVLEITERASLDEVKDVRARAGALRKMGFRLAIDDLGAGYAGLTTFAQLEPEVVKLDMSLVRNANEEPIKHKLIRSMIDLCREMKVLVVAEGVETPAERDMLVDMGCDLLQGYLFARPGRGFPEPVW
ncbi:MAG: EAL domain-containing response regulator, partial [Myxococcota bacterium]